MKRKKAKLEETISFSDEIVAFDSTVYDSGGGVKKRIRMAPMKDGRVYLNDRNTDFDYVLLDPTQIPHLLKVVEIARKGRGKALGGSGNRVR